MSDLVDRQGSNVDQVAASLAEEHGVLRQAVHSRAEPVVRAAEAGTWPATELTELVNYLQLEVLRQIADEEWLLFRNARRASDEFAALRRTISSCASAWTG
jgi:hemerythrin-like domain-containing protein